MNRRFRRRFKFWVCNIAYDLVIVTQYTVASKLLQKYQNEYQPVIALTFIFARELHAWVKRKFIDNLADGDESGAQAMGIISVGTRYTIMMCYTLGTNATFPTEVFLMTFDFVCNMYLCVKLIWLNKRRPEDVEKQIDLIQELALNELMEFITPLSFILAFILAYHGPNVAPYDPV